MGFVYSYFLLLIIQLDLLETTPKGLEFCLQKYFGKQQIAN